MLVYLVLHRHFPMFVSDEDIVQEGMIGLWYAAKHHNAEKGTFSTLAATCIYNNIAAYLRRQSRYKARVFPVDPDDMYQFAENKSTRIDDLYADLEGWIKTLDPKVQQMVQLRVQGKSCQEVGERLGCSRQYVDQSLSKARESFGRYI